MIVREWMDSVFLSLLSGSVVRYRGPLSLVPVRLKESPSRRARARDPPEASSLFSTEMVEVSGIRGRVPRREEPAAGWLHGYRICVRNCQLRLLFSNADVLDKFT